MKWLIALADLFRAFVGIRTKVEEFNEAYGENKSKVITELLASLFIIGGKLLNDETVYLKTGGQLMIKDGLDPVDEFIAKKIKENPKNLKLLAEKLITYRNADVDDRFVRVRRGSLKGFTQLEELRKLFYKEQGDKIDISYKGKMYTNRPDTMDEIMYIVDYMEVLTFMQPYRVHKVDGTFV